MKRNCALSWHAILRMEPNYRALRTCWALTVLGKWTENEQFERATIAYNEDFVFAFPRATSQTSEGIFGTQPSSVPLAICVQTTGLPVSSSIFNVQISTDLDEITSRVCSNHILIREVPGSNHAADTVLGRGPFPSAWSPRVSREAPSVLLESLTDPSDCVSIPMTPRSIAPYEPISATLPCSTQPTRILPCIETYISF